MYIGILCFSESESNEIVFYLSLKFGCSIDTAQQQMALNFELVVSDQFFSVVLAVYKWFKINASGGRRRHMWQLGKTNPMNNNFRRRYRKWNNSIMHESCHIQSVEIDVKYWNFIWIFQLKKRLRPNFAFWGTFRVICTSFRSFFLAEN